MAFRSGTSGRVTMGGVNWNVTGWEANEERAELETTNSESGGVYECILDYAKVSGTVTLEVDDSQLPYGSALGMSDGSSIAASMHLGTTSGPAYSCSTALISNLSTSNQRGSVVTATANYVFSGAYSSPS